MRIEAGSLAEAAREAVARNDFSVMFRRNRELIDVHERFRRFRFGDRAFIVKRASCADELDRALEVHRRLADVRHIRVLVPEHAGDGLLVAEDLGVTLHEQGDFTRELVARGEIGALLRLLLGRGIVWEGMAPRNLIHAGGMLWLLDLEAVEFAERCSDLTRFKWRLNWEHLGALPQIEEAAAALPVWRAPLDAFERAYATLTGMTEPRAFCAEATLRSERPVEPPHDAPWMPFEAGHLADDVLPPSLSVVYTFATAAVREHRGEAAYAGLLADLHRAAAHAIDGGPRNVARALLCVLCPGIPDAAISFEALRTRRGLDAAFRRADLLDVVVRELANLILGAAGQRGTLDLILRGSHGQGVVSRISDVDFELSSRVEPRGARGVEDALRDALALLDVASEGSAGRPAEADLVAAGLTRDLHEWMELRAPGAPDHAPCWNADLYPASLDWLAPSAYERGGIPLSPKTLFFRVRTLIARVAFRHGLRFAATREQLAALAPLIGPEAAASLRGFLARALSAYEDGFVPEELLALDADVREAEAACRGTALEAERGGS